MEQYLGKKLLPNQTIDHINNNASDNRIENLQILSLSENIKKQKQLNPAKIYKFICPCCKNESEKLLRNVKGNKQKGKSGPYCSRKCAAKMTYKNPWDKKQ